MSREKTPADLEVKPGAEGAVAEGATPPTLTSQTSSLCAQMCPRQLVTRPGQRRALRPVSTEENPPRSPLLREKPLLQANWPRDPSDSQWP